jgi:hypothetical protein
MEERGVGRLRDRAHRDVALVTRAADRVVAFVPRPELVRFDVGESAEQLRFEQLESEARVERELVRSYAERPVRKAAQAFE